MLMYIDSMCGGGGAETILVVVSPFLSLPVLNSACQGLCVERSNTLSQSTALAFKTLI